MSQCFNTWSQEITSLSTKKLYPPHLSYIYLYICISKSISICISTSIYYVQKICTRPTCHIYIYITTYQNLYLYVYLRLYTKCGKNTGTIPSGLYSADFFLGGNPSIYLFGIILNFFLLEMSLSTDLIEFTAQSVGSV